MMIYQLQPRGAFHFGERGIGVEETADLLHSDTLFAALVAARRSLGEQPVPPDNHLPSLLPFLAGPPPLRISSALPYAGDVLFFPRPHIPLGRGNAFKQVTLLSEQALRQLCQAGGLTGNETDRAERELIHGRKVWVLPEERESIAQMLLTGATNPQQRQQMAAEFAQNPAAIRLWGGSDEPPTPHVAIDRRSSASHLFHTGRLRFAHGCGLSFWAQIDQPNYRPWLEEALTFLQDEGLGGKRSTGHGQFTFTATARTLPLVDAPNAWLTLALYHPHPDELRDGLLHHAWYQRIHRQGWISSPDGRDTRRKGIWMLREGSVLPHDVIGTMEDVRPDRGFDHPVWRCGYALNLPLRLEESATS